MDVSSLSLLEKTKKKQEEREKLFLPVSASHLVETEYLGDRAKILLDWSKRLEEEGKEEFWPSEAILTFI